MILESYKLYVITNENYCMQGLQCYSHQEKKHAHHIASSRCWWKLLPNVQCAVLSTVNSHQLWLWMPLFAQLSETVTIQEISGQRLFQHWKQFCIKIRSWLEIVWSRVSPYCYWPVWSTGTCTCIIISRQQTEVRPKSVIAHNSDPSSFTSPLPHPVIKLNTTIHCAHQSTFRAPKHLVCTKAPCTHQSTSIDIHSSSSDRAPDSSEDLESFTLICHMTFAYSSTSGICLPNIYDICVRQKIRSCQWCANEITIMLFIRMQNSKTPAGITSTMPQFAQETVDDVLVWPITNNFSPLHQTLVQLIESPGANLSPKTYNFLQQLFTFMTPDCTRLSDPDIVWSSVWCLVSGPMFGPDIGADITESPEASVSPIIYNFSHVWQPGYRVFHQTLHQLQLSTCVTNNTVTKFSRHCVANSLSHCVPLHYIRTRNLAEHSGRQLQKVLTFLVVPCI